MLCGGYLTPRRPAYAPAGRGAAESVTEDGRYFDKGWSRTIKHRSGDWYKGYIVGGRLYVPDLYDELESIYLGFPVVGVVFFLLFWAGGKFVCRRIDAGPSHHG